MPSLELFADQIEDYGKVVTSTTTTTTILLLLLLYVDIHMWIFDGLGIRSQKPPDIHINITMTIATTITTTITTSTSTSTTDTTTITVCGSDRRLWESGN